MFKNNLSDLFSDEDKESFNEGELVVLIDSHNAAYRTLFATIYSNPQDNECFNLWRHNFVNSIFSVINKFQPSKVVLAFDKKPSWRYEIYNGYKSNRKAARDKAVVDFDKFFPVFNEIIVDLKETFGNIYVMEIKFCEADDIIAILVKNEFKDKKVIMVSSDRDLNQLIDGERVQQYDPIQNKMLRVINPKNDLEIKIIKGDKSDTIPPIKPRTGIATAERMLKEGLDKILNKPENEQMKNNYIMNRQLIDFEYIPNKIRDLIINKYREYEIKEIDSKKLMNFFVKNQLMKLMSTWQGYSDCIRILK